MKPWNKRANRSAGSGREKMRAEIHKQKFRLPRCVNHGPLINFEEKETLVEPGVSGCKRRKAVAFVFIRWMEIGVKEFH